MKPNPFAKRRRVFVPGLLTSRFRRLMSSEPRLRIQERENLEWWAMHEHDDRCDELDGWKPWEREGSNRVCHWKTSELVGKLHVHCGCTLAKQAGDVPWERVVAPMWEAQVRHISAPLCRWSAEELPGVLLQHLTDLTQGFTTPLNPMLPVSREDLSVFDRLVEESLGLRLREASFGGILAALHLFPFWVRRPADFAPAADASPRETMRALMEHLFVVYPLPACLRNAWDTQGAWNMPSLRWMAWFILAGQGVSIQRNAALFGTAIPPHLIRWFVQAPAEFTPTRARVWAEIRAIGGGDDELRRIEAQPGYAFHQIDWTDEDAPGCTRLEFRAFWDDSVRWLARHREALTDEMCALILPWALHMLTEGCFSWKGRSPVQAHRLALEYDRQLRRRHCPNEDLSWTARGWDQVWADREGIEWSMTELTTGAELHHEGRAMSHCVAGYAAGCATGDSAIFSLRLAGERRVTVEVNPVTKAVVQAFGPGNCKLTPEDKMALAWWSESTLCS